MPNGLSIGAAIAIAAIAVAAIILAALAAARRSKAGVSAPGKAKAEPETGTELVAVIAAAVAAASGMEIGSFAVTGLRPAASGAAGGGGVSGAQRGFNTPAWGHAERLLRGERE
jgi:hypothetical protein